MTEGPIWRGIDRLGILTVGGLAIFAMVAPFREGSFVEHERMLVRAFGIALYLAVFLLATLLIGLSRRGTFVGGGWAAWRRAARWGCRWHGLTMLGMTLGAALGTIFGGLLGLLLPTEQPLVGYLSKGAANGAFYFLLWMPGLSMVICFMQAFGPKNPIGRIKDDGQG